MSWYLKRENRARSPTNNNNTTSLKHKRKDCAGRARRATEIKQFGVRCTTIRRKRKCEMKSRQIRKKKEQRPQRSVEDWVDLEYINEVIKTLGGCGHTRSPRLNYIIISLSKITGAISNLLDVLIIGNNILLQRKQGQCNQFHIQYKQFLIHFIISITIHKAKTNNSISFFIQQQYLVLQSSQYPNLTKINKNYAKHHRIDRTQTILLFLNNLYEQQQYKKSLKTLINSGKSIFLNSNLVFHFVCIDCLLLSYNNLFSLSAGSA